MRSLLLQLVKSLILLLKMDGLLFDEHLEIALVVQDLLEVLFDTGYKKLILMETLLHVLVFLLQRSDTLLDLAQLIVCLSQQVLQLQVLVVCLALERLKLFKCHVSLLDLAVQVLLIFLRLELSVFQL